MVLDKVEHFFKRQNFIKRSLHSVVFQPEQCLTFLKEVELAICLPKVNKEDGKNPRSCWMHEIGQSVLGSSHSGFPRRSLTKLSVETEI